MQYVWNNFSSHFVNINVGVGQGSVLSPILSALYLASFLHILEKCLKNLNLQISLLFFVDDGLLITQSKFFVTSNAHIFCSYNVVFNLLTKFELHIKHLKTKVFHFSRVHSTFNPPPLNLFPLSGSTLSPKPSWHYLGFIFNRKLSFHNHINFYANKVISTIKCMKILGNSTRGLNPCQKQLLYRCCAMPIALYGFQLLSRSQKVNFVSFCFFLIFYFIFDLFLIFSIFRALRLGLRSDLSHCHISHIWWYGHNIDHRT